MLESNAAELSPLAGYGARNWAPAGLDRLQGRTRQKIASNVDSHHFSQYLCL
jgi:hypothetical protein